MKLTHMKSKFLLSLTLLLCLAGLAMAQEPNWGNNKAAAMENYTLLTDYTKANDFKSALPHLRWLLKNTPDLSKNLYIYGSQVYEGMVDQTKDPKLLTTLQDSALLMYDLRVKHFQDEANVLNRKGIKAYPYLSNRPNYVDELYPLYKKIVELNGEETYNTNIQVYMSLMCETKKKGGLTDEQVLEEFDKINAITEKKLTSGDAATKQRWSVTKDYLDKTLQGCVTIDCNFIKSKMGPKLKQNPDDIQTAKKIFGLMATGKCTDDPLFFEAGEAMVKKEPSYGVYRVLAKISQGNKNYDKALNYFEESIKLANTGDEKAESYMDIAQLYHVRGSKESARNYYRKAGESGKREAYARIGDLYLSSGDACKDANPIKAKLVYIAAYEMYEKAGDRSGMSKAKQYFPSAEEIFTQGMTEKIGTQMNTGCWVGESVTLQKK